MTYAIIFIFGAIIGSFLNVCIYRIPRKEPVCFSWSRCPSCKKPIKWYDNIPFLSYIFLMAKCRSCKARISFRYFAVELISALSFLILFMNFGLTYRFWTYSLVTVSLIIVTFIDLEFQIIPDRISIGGLIAGILLSIFLPGLHNALTWKDGVVNSLLGALVGGGLIYSMGVFGKAVFRKESMGGGDVKLMAMLGAFLGWKMAIFIFFLAPFFGTPAALYLKFVRKIDIIPYGPYISMASFAAMIYGQRILNSLFYF
ncbi:MAG: prepilin peptidase [Candidatus Omnitrophica bacterium]|nr:prepilin peptidase [Candidatus Omnitrophota bacterium]MBU4457682.1 prepilin peptidase [Candidatus Omnitrophota bacterium]